MDDAKWAAWEQRSRRETDRRRPPEVRYVHMPHLPCRKCGTTWRIPLDNPLQIRSLDEAPNLFLGCKNGHEEKH